MSTWFLNWAQGAWWWRPLACTVAAALVATAVRSATLRGGRALAEYTGSPGLQPVWTLLLQVLLLAALGTWLVRRQGVAAWAFLVAVAGWVTLALLGQHRLSYLVLAAAVLLLCRRQGARLPALLGICTASWVCADATAIVSGHPW
ncbi:hypothetical protein [Kitasatospora sp. NPDC047058]|uniref:hypothetical protein n=1 Tax=Kitasatospora sp. NPDC047058 TaxID=3155620 RepID=UPI0033CFE0F5